MARGNPGKLVQYTDASGKVQKAIMRNKDQHPKFKEVKKAFLELINDDYTRARDDKQRPQSALVSIDKLTLLGYVD